MTGRFAGFAAMSMIWGMTWMATKTATLVVPPIFLATARFLLAGAIFLAAAGLLRLRLRPPSLPRTLVSAFLITTVTYSTSFWGVAHAPSGLAAIVNLSLLPVFVIALGAVSGEETVTRGRLGGVALGIVGLLILFSGRTRTPGGDPDEVWGLLAVVVGTFGYAWGAIVSRPLIRVLPPVSLAAWQSGVGGLLLVPVTLALEGWDGARVSAFADPRAGAGLAFLVFGGSLTAFTLYLWLLRDWGPFRAGLYCFVSPIVAVAVGSIWAGESFSATEGIGMAVMLAATALAMGRPATASAATGSRPAHRDGGAAR